MQSKADGIKTRHLSHFSLFSLVYGLICACLVSFYAHLVGVVISEHVTKMAAASFNQP